MELILMKNINKKPKKIEYVDDDGNNQVRQQKIGDLNSVKAILKKVRHLVLTNLSKL